MIHREPLESVTQRSSTILVAEVQHVSEPKKEGYWQSVEIAVLPVEVIFGQIPRENGGVFSCRYSQGLPHERQGATISPLVTGSGLELQLKKGDRVVLLLDSDPDISAPAPLPLLRAEPPSHIALLRQLTAQGTARR